MTDQLTLKLADREQAMRTAEELLKKDAPDAADITAIKAVQSSILALDGEIAGLQDREDIAKDIAKRRLDAGIADLGGRPSNYGTKSDEEDIRRLDNIQVPAYCKARTPRHLIKATLGNREEAQKVAYAIGQFATSVIGAGSALGMKAQKWLADHGFAVKSAQSENSNTSGGYLVPIELAGYIIQLMEEFGVFRKYANVKPMKGDTLNIPRRAGTISAYWLGDNAAITASAKTWDMVSLTAKKLAALIYFSNEIAEDAMVDIGDDLADELAWNFSYMEDNAGFNGTGTSATGGIIGLSGAFANAFGALTTIGKGGVKVGSAGSGGALSNLTLSDFTSMMGLLPDFAWKRGDPKWYVSKQLYYSTMVELLASGGGNTVLTLQQGPTRPQFLGADVVFVQVMPTAAAASVNYAYFGDLSLSSSLGDRKLLTIATSDQIGFPNDQLAIRGISRVDINNHDVGGNQANTLAQNPSYDQTGATYYSGPIVTLQSYNS